MIRTFLRFLGILGTPLGHPRGNSSISTSILHQPPTNLALWREINFCKESLSVISLYHIMREKTVGLLKVSEQFFKGFKIAEVICPRIRLNLRKTPTRILLNKVVISFKFYAGNCQLIRKEVRYLV